MEASKQEYSAQQQQQKLDKQQQEINNLQEQISDIKSARFMRESYATKTFYLVCDCILF
ncbi:hypothetical protein QEO94_09455 [Kingella negevensis]|uniref:hypothetical protein n=1 Tax=Kingella negevensis TaxID=1522312 RepID=UPI002542E18D|nr:hypothetical protein [Kingella negevensis]WII92846.1 hypothetical protein QEO94_09455 [Kingella negevensis]